MIELTAGHLTILKILSRGRMKSVDAQSDFRDEIGHPSSEQLFGPLLQELIVDGFVSHTLLRGHTAARPIDEVWLTKKGEAALSENGND